VGPPRKRKKIENPLVTRRWIAFDFIHIFLPWRYFLEPRFIYFSKNMLNQFQTHTLSLTEEIELASMINLGSVSLHDEEFVSDV
jgi:hypothetical protein